MNLSLEEKLAQPKLQIPCDESISRERKPCEIGGDFHGMDEVAGARRKEEVVQLWCLEELSNAIRPTLREGDQKKPLRETLT